MYETTVGELVRVHGNAFLVGASVAGMIVIVGAPVLVGPGGSPNALDRDTVANLVSWLIMVGGLKREDLAPVFEANGVPPPWASENH